MLGPKSESRRGEEGEVQNKRRKTVHVVADSSDSAESDFASESDDESSDRATNRRRLRTRATQQQQPHTQSAYPTRRATRHSRDPSLSPPPPVSERLQRMREARAAKPVQKTYAEIGSDDDDDAFAATMASTRPRSSASSAQFASTSTSSRRNSLVEDESARRQTRRASAPPNASEGEDDGFMSHRATRSARGSRRPSEEPSASLEAKKETMEVSESSESAPNDNAQESNQPDNSLQPQDQPQQQQPPKFKKISLKLGPNTDEVEAPSSTDNQHELNIEDDDEGGEPIVTSSKSRSKRRITSDDEDDEFEPPEDAVDDEYEYDDPVPSDEDEDLYNRRRGRDREHTSRYETRRRSEPRYSSYPTRESRSLRSRSSTAPTTTTSYDIDHDHDEATETQKQPSSSSHLSRAARAANRQRRYEDEYEDFDIPSDDLDSTGRRKRKLRPRNQQVDYSRQLHPGAGWNGQSAEVLLVERSLGRINANGREGRKRDRDRSPDRDRAFHYRPGRFNAGVGGDTNASADSDDEDKGGGRYEGGGRSREPSGGISVQGGGSLDPVNIMEILRAQESAIIKDLPEEERIKYQENARLFRSTGGKDLADTDPVSTSTVNFDSIGGLEEHIRSLKEMVVMPLLYPEIFSGFQITPPRGVLFHGPPGTGKTLMARALATSCSTSTQKVAFFMRKGADVLSKWVGESERQLRLLFEQAKTHQPSIIFFDEIDGLAPVRSSKQDQIHASIVSTLLALMDGLDSRGQVVVIGATNRIDAIDPALRRPGRFDRELYFPLPSEPARKKIISITTAKWTPPLQEKLLDDLAKSTRGYCGADVRSLCTEAALNAVRRSYPEIYESGHKLQIDTNDILVTAEDFAKSMKNIIPSTQRTSTVYSNPIPAHLRPLVQTSYDDILASLNVLCPLLQQVAEANVSGFMADSGSSAPIQLASNPYLQYSFSFQPRLLICGSPGMGQRLLGPAALERLDAAKVYIQSLDLSTLLNDSARTPDAALIQLFHEMKRHRPAVLYIPDIDLWWETLPDAAKHIFTALLERDAVNPVMILATSEKEFGALPGPVRRLIQGRLGEACGIEGWKRVIEAGKPGEDARKSFFVDLIASVSKPPRPIFVPKEPSELPKPKRKAPLERAPSPPPRDLTPAEVQALFDHDEALRRQLRIELRFIINDMKRSRKFGDFHRGVDRDQFPDYDAVVTRPMDLETLLFNINDDQYATLQEFINDFECIIDSAEEYNEPGSVIIGKAYDLQDNFMMYVETLKKKEPRFVWELEQSQVRCRLLNLRRKREGLPLLGRERRHEGLEEMRREKREEFRAKLEERRQAAELKREQWEKQKAERAARAAAEVDGDLETDGGPDNNEDSDMVVVGPSPRKHVRVIVDDEDEEETQEGSRLNPDGSSSSLISVVEQGIEGTGCSSTTEPLVSEAVAQNLEDVEMAETEKETPVPVDSVVVQPEVESEIGDTGSKECGTQGIPTIANQTSSANSEEAVIQNDDDEDVQMLEEEELAAKIFEDEIADDSAAQIEAEPEEPARDVVVDMEKLAAFERSLVTKTDGLSVSDLEALGVALSGVVYRHSQEWERDEMLRELEAVLCNAERVWIARRDDNDDQDL